MARKMKDSGIEWIGEIPEGWEIHRIKTHFSIISGSGFKPELQGQSTGDFPVCKASDISSSGHYLHTSANYITSDIVKSQHFSIIPKGSILFAKIGEAMRKNNRSLCSLDCCVDNNCQGLVPKNISSEFSYYLFTCIDMTWFDNAGTIPCINNQKLYDCRIPFPSYGEQTLIANHLNIQCAKINEMLFHIRSSIEEYKKLKQTVITQAVTKGVRGKREMKDSGVEWIGEIPKEWSTPKIKRLHNGLTDGTHGTFNRIDSGHILLSSKNVREFGIQLGENESFISEADYNLITANGFPQKDDVLLCCIGASIGRCTLYEFEEAMAFQRSVIFIRCNSLILPRMMMYDLRSSNTLLQEQLLVNQSAQAGLYQGLVSEIFISLPPISEQKEIIATVYKGNIIKNLIMDCQSYTKYRPNETTGGIFVSWRRKEELPTGA